jgi:hypothetical protein
MQAAGEIHGTVVEHSTGLPIEGIEVCPRWIGTFENGEAGYCGRTDAAGEYTVRNLGTGEYQVAFDPGETVNYVRTTIGPESVAAGSAIEVDAELVRGVEFKGTVTEAGTGQPVKYLGGDHGAVAVCALGPFSEARAKCVPVDPDGEYVLAGLPPGRSYVVVFGEDTKEEGSDLHPDGYVRQYWNGVSTFAEAEVITAGAGTVLEEIDGELIQGEEVWPGEEELGGGGTGSGSGDSGSQTSSTSSSSTVTTPATTPSARVSKPALKCKKGFRKVTKSGHARCVKIKKPRRHHHKKASHR